MVSPQSIHYGADSTLAETRRPGLSEILGREQNLDVAGPVGPAIRPTKGLAGCLPIEAPPPGRGCSQTAGPPGENPFWGPRSESITRSSPHRTRASIPGTHDAGGPAHR